MSEELTFEQAKELRERTLAEAGRLYREDITLRRICDTVTSEALADADVDDKQAVDDMVRKAVMTALAMACGSTDLNYVMRERDAYREQVMKMAGLSAVTPLVYLSAEPATI